MTIYKIIKMKLCTALALCFLLITITSARVHCDGSMSCKDGQTCCRLVNGSWGCCPYSNAECCPDKMHCCPSDKRCATTLGISRCVDRETGEFEAEVIGLVVPATPTPSEE